MIFTQSKILKIPTELNPKMQYYIATKATKENLAKLKIQTFEEGITVQPSVKYGITCRKNVFGYTEVNKNIPKENRCIRTIYWEWQLFSGEWQSDYRDIYKDCYQKIEHKPFDIEIKLITINNNPMLVTKVETFENIKNIINLYLEVFDYCETLDNHFQSSYEKVNCSRYNWIILPPEIKIEINRVKEAKKKKDQRNYKDYNQERLNELEKYNPIKRYEGQNGFQGYYAFIYKKRCVLESPVYGNATYIVKNDNWEELSKMTKKALINSGELLFRIEHKKTWFEAISKVIQ